MTHSQSILTLFGGFTAPPPTQSVSEWCEQSLRLNEPGNVGPFSLRGREFVREPLDLFSDRTVTDEALCWGSQIGKTTMLMGGMGWSTRHACRRALWVMPAHDKAASFCATRFRPMLEASPTFADDIPRGAARFRLTNHHIRMCGSIIDFVGSNSPSQLSSNPCQLVLCDETDKFAEATEKEADACNLADQRTKDCPTPLRLKTSTPTTRYRFIWAELLAGDLRRYFVPCPHCGKEVLLMWGKEYSLLDRLGCEAYVTWDQGAKSGDTWDYARVEATAHAVCPHCQGKIRDGHKPAMIAAGRWKPTNPNAPTCRRSYHLSSLYSVVDTCRFGRLAVAFLQQKDKPGGLQGFVSGYLAEPWENQQSAIERYEILVSQSDPLPEGGGEKVLTCDRQEKAPFLWWAVMAWYPQVSRVVEIGTCNTDAELYEVQLRHGIPDHLVVNDAGDLQTDVLRACLDHGRAVAVQGYQLPAWRGWQGAKGMPRRRWKSAEARVFLPWSVAMVRQARGESSILMPLLEFSADDCKDILETLRKHRTTKTRMEFPREVCTEQFWQHMDAEHVVLTGSIQRWRKRHDRLRDEFRDCVVMQIAHALYRRRLNWAADFAPPSRKPQETKTYELQPA